MVHRRWCNYRSMEKDCTFLLAYILPWTNTFILTLSSMDQQFWRWMLTLKREDLGWMKIFWLILEWDLTDLFWHTKYGSYNMDNMINFQWNRPMHIMIMIKTAVSDILEETVHLIFGWLTCINYSYRTNKLFLYWIF